MLKAFKKILMVVFKYNIVIYLLNTILCSAYIILLLYDFRIAGLIMTVIGLCVAGSSWLSGSRFGYRGGYQEGGETMLRIVMKEITEDSNDEEK